MSIRYGDVYYADLSPVVGSEQGGVRPVVVIQNDVGNKFSPTVIVAAITAQIQKAKLPTHVEVKAKECGLEEDSVILLEQIRTIDKQRLTDKVTHFSDEILDKMDYALMISLNQNRRCGGNKFNTVNDNSSKRRELVYV